MINKGKSQWDMLFPHWHVTITHSWGLIIVEPLRFNINPQCHVCLSHLSLSAIFYVCLSVHDLSLSMVIWGLQHQQCMHLTMRQKALEETHPPPLSSCMHQNGMLRDLCSKAYIKGWTHPSKFVITQPFATSPHNQVISEKVWVVSTTILKNSQSIGYKQ